MIKSKQPVVSVIIPNYNHARYLPQRIESVLNQTYQDIEVILMDDCSSDASRAIIERYAAQDARIRLVYNEQNSGSTFKQWNKGIALAAGSYVWLAESDDYAAPELLATLVACLDRDPLIGLAYCNSFSVDEEGKPHALNLPSNEPLAPEPTWEPFLAQMDADLWKQNFTASGLELVRRFMSYRNIIPNASAVLLRRTTLLLAGPADERFKILGDWLFWAKILSISNLSYVAQPLNYFRSHSNNVRNKTRENGTALVEITQMLAIMREYGTPDPNFYKKSVEELFTFWFKSLVYHQVPASRHRAVYRNMLAIEPEFRSMFLKAFRNFLFRNKLSGIRMLIGDKYLFPLLKKVK
jgi:glycosyltransferase involved in cell wall biosynthesis